MRLLLTLTFVTISFFAYNQNYSWEIGGGGGTAHYFGDIGGKGYDAKFGPADIMFDATSLNFNLFARYAINYRWYSNFRFSYINIHGDDKNSPGTGRERRNLNFTNNIYEVTANAEYHLVIINDFMGRRKYSSDFHWFIGAGLGMMYHNPRAIDGNNFIPLQPLHTEGPEKSYSLVQLVVPFSTGVFMSVKGRYTDYKIHRFGITLNYRYTFTDYLDDVSSTYPDVSVFDGDQTAINYSYRGFQKDPSLPNSYPNQGQIRGNPKEKDGYLTTSIFYSRRILIGKKRHKLPRNMEFYGRPKKRRRR